MKKTSALKILFGVAALGTALWAVYHFFFASKSLQSSTSPGSTGSGSSAGSNTGSTGSGSSTGSNTGSSTGSGTTTTTPPPAPVAAVMKKNSRLSAFTKTAAYQDSNLSNQLTSYWWGDPIYFEVGEYVGTVQTDGPYGGSIKVSNYSNGDKLGDTVTFYVPNKKFTITN